MLQQVNDYWFAFTHPSAISVLLIVAGYILNIWVKRHIDTIYDKIENSCTKKELEELSTKMDKRLTNVENKMIEVNDYLSELRIQMEKIEFKFDFIKEQIEKMANKIDILFDK